ncbi:MAG: hypothetical protein IH948_10645, partial [Bacteroidetes bacterium]|nr:hypothetical protein [Bacteroidota bacterium]
METKKIVLIATAVSLVVGGVFAYFNQPGSVIERVVERVIEKTVGAIPGSQIPAAHELGELRVEITSGFFQEASSTQFAILNPFSATSTAIVRQISGVTGSSSIVLSLGTSSVPALSSTTPTGADLDLTVFSIEMPTSSRFYFDSSLTRNQEQFVVTDAQKEKYEDLVFANSSTTLLRAITVGPTDYLMLAATGTGPRDWDAQEDSITASNNVFRGTYDIEWYR